MKTILSVTLVFLLVSAGAGALLYGVGIVSGQTTSSDITPPVSSTDTYSTNSTATNSTASTSSTEVTSTSMTLTKSTTTALSKSAIQYSSVKTVVSTTTTTNTTVTTAHTLTETAGRTYSPAHLTLSVRSEGSLYCGLYYSGFGCNAPNYNPSSPSPIRSTVSVLITNSGGEQGTASVTSMTFNGWSSQCNIPLKVIVPAWSVSQQFTCTITSPNQWTSGAVVFSIELL